MTQPTIKDELINLFTRQLNLQTEKGVQKYGHTLDDCPDDKFEWREMLIEELLDALQYQQKEFRRLQEVLKFYADSENYQVNVVDQWGPEINVMMDGGAKAAQALEGKQ